MLLKALNFGSRLHPLLQRLGMGMFIPKRSIRGLTSNRRGIFLIGYVFLSGICLINHGYAADLQSYRVASPEIHWVNYNRPVEWEDALNKCARMDNIVITGTFFDMNTYKPAYAKYTRNLRGFYGVTLVKDGEICYHPRQQGYKTLDLNSFTRRIAVGYTKNGDLILCWGTQPLLSVAIYMKILGCEDVVGLDGGGSAGVYIRGNTELTPQRRISNVYIID